MATPDELGLKPLAVNKSLSPDDLGLKPVLTPDDLGLEPVNQSDISQGEAAARGTFSGVSSGFVDELAGGVEAVGRKIGLTGLGGSFSDIRRATPEERAQDFSEVRRERTAQRRAEDKAAQEAHPKTFLGAEIASGVALGFAAPAANFTRLTGTSMKGIAAAGAMSGAVAGTGYSEGESVGEVATDAAIGAGIGAVAGPALVKTFQKLSDVVTKRASSPAARQIAAEEMAEATRSAQPISTRAANDIADSLDESLSARITERANQILANKSQQDIVGPIKIRVKGDDVEYILTDSTKKEYANWLLLRKPGAKLTEELEKKADDILAGMGPVESRKHWDSFIESRAMLQAAADVRDATTAGWLRVKDPMADRAKSVINLRAASHNAQITDSKLQTNFYGAVVKGTHAERSVSRDAYSHLKAANSIQKETNQVFGKDSDKLYQFLDKGITDGLTAEQLSVANKWRGLYKNFLDHLRDLGMNIDERINFISHIKADEGTIKARLLNQIPQIQDELDQLLRSGRLYDQANRLVDRQNMRPEVREFLAAMKDLSDGQKFESMVDIRKFIRSIGTKDSPTKKKLGYEMGTAFQREGNMPEILREKDVTKNFFRYVNGNLKGYYYRDFFEELNKNIAVLDALKLKEASGVWNEYARQMSGTPSDFMAMMEAKAGSLREFGKQLAADTNNPLVKKLGDAIQVVPDFIGWTTAQIYPNMLGWRLDAPVRNLSQTILLTAPEIGGKYGYKVVGKAWAQAIRAKASGVDIEKFLESKGLRAGAYMGDNGLEAIQDGLKNMGLAAKSIDKLGKIGMYLYGKSDDVNRFITWHAGQNIAEDMIAGKFNKLQTFLKRMPAGYRANLTNALRKNNPDEVKDLVSKYLVEQSQFSYTRSDLSKYGRDFGKLFTMFTKWPTMIAGDMERIAAVEATKAASVQAIGMKYFAPLAGLAIAQAGLDAVDAEENPLHKVLIARNLTKFAPALSIELSTPPVASSSLKVISAGMRLGSGEVEEAGKLLKDAASPFTPGGFSYQFYNRYLKDDE